jgi:hypothetical protein
MTMEFTVEFYEDVLARDFATAQERMRDWQKRVQP